MPNDVFYSDFLFLWCNWMFLFLAMMPFMRMITNNKTTITKIFILSDNINSNCSYAVSRKPSSYISLFQPNLFDNNPFLIKYYFHCDLQTMDKRIRTLPIFPIYFILNYEFKKQYSEFNSCPILIIFELVQT